ncbi:MAG TPA: response regulator [Gemmata sp.]|jgi:HD-like signal output (HDOD) protein|nr:response regulator [Gemmata sp.]
MSHRVLFVADDPNLQRSLRLMLEPLQKEWEGHFSRGGPDVFARLDESAFDTLVTDSRLAGTNCGEMLTEVRRCHPQTVRIALINPKEEDDLVRLASVAHRLLAKPCDQIELHAAIQRAHSLRELLKGSSLAAVVGRLGSVPTLSTLYTRIADELMFPNYSLATVGDLVAQDLGIAARMLQMANSALVGLRRPATTPNQAVRILGADLTRTLVLAADLFSRYNPISLKPFSIELLWEHGQQVAELATQIARAERAGDRVVRESGLAGLFHDIGRLTLASQLPGPYREVMGAMLSENLSAADAERRLFGASHAEVGAYLLGLWGLPDPLVEAVAWHHDPSACPGNSFTPLTAVHVADAVLRAEEGVLPDMEYLERLGLAERWDVWKELPAKEVQAK